MSTDTKSALVPATEGDQRRDALMRALGFDKLQEGVRELALAIAQQYDLDPMLRHVVMVDGKPYITRDGLLHVAHKSGDFDGIEVDPPTLDEDKRFFRTTCRVYRKSFSRPFVYPGRYPATGGNQRYNEEMCIKVAEVMTLRRAFDVSAPVIEERWDGEIEAPTEQAQPTSLAERVAQRALAAGGEQEQPVAGAIDAQALAVDSPLNVDTETGEILSNIADDEEVEEAAFVAAVAEPEEDDPETTAEVFGAIADAGDDEPEEEPEPEAPPVVSPLREQKPESLEPEQAAGSDASPLDLFKAWARGRDTVLIRSVAKDLFPNATGFSELTAQELGILQHAVLKAETKRDEASGSERCADPSPLTSNRCTLDPGHKGTHHHGTRESWDAK